MERYSTLCCLVRAALSIFTGPIVECSLSLLNNIIDGKLGKMQVDTYRYAYQIYLVIILPPERDNKILPFKYWSHFL